MSWEDLERRNKVRPEGDPDLARLHARVFDTKDGAELLRLWKARLDGLTDPEISERALRAREGQRNLLRMFELLVQRGKEPS